jgi:hypothetical protein
VFVVSLFRRDLSIYEVHNNGAWYNFGYLFGLACFFGGSGNRAPRRAVKSGTLTEVRVNECKRLWVLKKSLRLAGGIQQKHVRRK